LNFITEVLNNDANSTVQNAGDSDDGDLPVVSFTELQPSASTARTKSRMS
jgi:hypothetical protein